MHFLKVPKTAELGGPFLKNWVTLFEIVKKSVICEGLILSKIFIFGVNVLSNAVMYLTKQVFDTVNT